MEFSTKTFQIFIFDEEKERLPRSNFSVFNVLSYTSIVGNV
jgi:hypothetical protein